MIWLAFGKPSTREGEQLELRLVDWLYFGVNLHDVIYNSDYLQIDKWKQYQKICRKEKEYFIVEENLFLLKVSNVFDAHCSLAEI